VARVAIREVEHGVVEAVEAGERDELESIAHGAELALEAPDRGVVEILAPVERRRAVVREQLAGKLRVNLFGELLRELQVRLAGFAPDEVGVGCVRET